MTMIRDILQKVSEEVTELTEETAKEIESKIRADWTGSEAYQIGCGDIESKGE